MKKSDEKNAEWRIANPTRLQIWKTGSRQCYLTPPMKLPISELIERGDISVPPVKKNLFADYGIIAAAFVKHARGFYIERAKTDYYVLAFVLSGSYSISYNGKKHSIKRGMFYSAPPAAALTSFSPKADIEALWFHIKKTPYWREKLGREFFCAESERAEILSKLAEVYTEGAYKSGTPQRYLRNAAELIFANIDAELARFSAAETPQKRLQQLAARAAKNGITLAEAAKYCGLSAAVLNAQFVRRHGATFSKYALAAKMDFARAELARNADIEKLARECGFADRHAFSKSYARYWGETPRGKKIGAARK